MLDQYEEGYDLTALKCIYHRPRRQSDGKYTKGSLDIVYRDNTTGKKHVERIYDPEYVYYMIKDSKMEEEHLDYTPMYMEKEYCNEISVPYRLLEKDIAERIGRPQLYWEYRNSGDRNTKGLIHTLDHRVMSSDLDIENHYMARFGRKFKNSPYTISKGYLDIETDFRTHTGSIAEHGECPVNAITYIHAITKDIYVFLLRTKDNPLIDEWWSLGQEKIVSNFYDLLYIRLGKKTIDKYALGDYKFHFTMYEEEDELKMITDLFDTINELQPDFVMAWNMRFDIPYLIDRIQVLGGDPKDIICQPDFSEQKLFYKIDKDSVIEKRNEYCISSTYCIYLDQLLMYAAIRKGTKVIKSFALDVVCSIECHFGKLDYSDITPYLVELPFKNYQTFVFYNIMDVIDQVCIEMSTKDIDQIFLKILDNRTMYKNINSRSVYLVNQFREFCYERGYILCNNLNFNNEKKEKYPGAYVAPVFLLNNYSRTELFGTFINVFLNLDDFDFSRLYPTMIQMFNLFPNSLIGNMIFPDEKMNNMENISDMGKMFRREGMFVDDMATENYIEICKRWFNLAGMNELLDDIEEFFTKYRDPEVFVPFIKESGKRVLFNVRHERNNLFKKKKNRLFSVVNRKPIRNIYSTYDISRKKGELNETYNDYLGYDAFDTTK